MVPMHDCCLGPEKIDTPKMLDLQKKSAIIFKYYAGATLGKQSGIATNLHFPQTNGFI